MAAHRVASTNLGVTGFGQSGALDVYRYHGIGTDSIVPAALDLVDQLCCLAGARVSLAVG